MVIATIAPEFISLMAADDYDAAKTLQRLMKKRVRWWTLTHGYYANMGGWKVSPTFTSGLRIACAFGDASICVQQS